MIIYSSKRIIIHEREISFWKKTISEYHYSVASVAVQALYRGGHGN